MASWGVFATEAPELAAFGAERFAAGVAFLATLRPDGSPRVHPVTPIIGEGRLFVFMEPTSPKGRDLRRDGRYALHSVPLDSEGSGGEFLVRGHGRQVDDANDRRLAVGAASYSPAERYVLYELDVIGAMATEYQQGETVRQRWGTP